MKTLNGTAIALVLGLGLASAGPAFAQANCDLDDNGYVSTDEANQCAEQDFDTMVGGEEAMSEDAFTQGFTGAEDSAGMFAAADADGDGQVTREEWIEWRGNEYATATAGNAEGLTQEQFDAWRSSGVLKSQGADSQSAGGDDEGGAGTSAGGGSDTDSGGGSSGGSGSGGSGGGSNN